jgi:hypothetical protein
MKAFLLIGCLCIGGVLHAQTTNRENYDLRPTLKKSKTDPDKACIAFDKILEAMPQDARFTTFIRNDSIILTHSDASWFWKLMASKNDGVAIDLVSKDQYACDNVQRFASSWSHKGFLLPPLYREDMRKNMLPTQNDYVALYAGKVPGTWKKDILEANYLLLQDKHLCYYSNVINLDFNGWSLLHNGLYYDTFPHQTFQRRYQEVSKTLHFTIPFEKDKWDYKQTDIRPLYDSLNLTDYTIKAIRIHTYTSVEGTRERNEKLQQQRAESIVRSLQAFQPEALVSTVTASENWVEFMNDIAGSGFSNLMPLSKDEIKERLTSPALLAKLEPTLRHHRKALIELDLEKRISYLQSTAGELKKYFHQELANRNMEEALYLQQIIFYRIKREELPDTFLHEIEVPESLEYGSLLLNNVSFQFENSYSTVFEAINTFEKLDILLKENPKIKYNLCALRLQSWRESPLLVDQHPLLSDIQSLANIGIPELLVRRLLINYNILLSESSLRQKKYAEKEKAVKFIHAAYSTGNLSDEDLLNLAKYFSYNSKFDWAEKILQPRTNAIDVSEDLLFYYLNLTLFDEHNTKNSSYRAVLLNAINGNQPRFCKLFDSIKNGGVTFQLLNDPYLKKTYCENCH